MGVPSRLCFGEGNSPEGKEGEHFLGAPRCVGGGMSGRNVQ